VTGSYQFVDIAACNMCGADATHADVLGRRLNRPQGLRPVRRGGIALTIVRCRTCQLIYPNPLPLPAALEQHYGMGPELYWRDSYFAESPGGDYFAEQLRTFFRLHGDQRGLRALDVGAGIGKGIDALMAGGLEAWGIEPGEAFARRARERTGLDETQLSCRSIETASFDREQFDLITFGAVLEHLRDPGGAIAKAVDWLKPGGLIHAEVPSSRWLTNRIVNAAYRFQGLDYAANLSPMHPPYHLYEFELSSFQHHGQHHSYRIAHHTRYVCDTFLPRQLNPILKPWMAITGTGMQLEVWLRPH
jgi:SAM-dependent methyltransferase